MADAPAASPVLLGIAHVAMYDTAVALGLRAEPFLHREPAARHTSAEAAVAAATYHVLVVRLPGQRDFLTATYRRYLAGIPAVRRSATASTWEPASPPACWPGGPATAWTARCRTSSARPDRVCGSRRRPRPRSGWR